MNRPGLTIVLMLLAIGAGPAHGGNPGAVFSVSILEDPGGRWRLDDVQAGAPAAAFELLEQSSINLGYTRSAWWLRLDIALPPAGGHLLEIGYAQIDRIDIFLPDPPGWRLIEAGDTRPRPAELLHYPTPVLFLPEGLQGEVFIRVVTDGSLLIPLAIHDSRQFMEHAGASQLGFGIYYAFLLAMAIYNLFLFSAIRDRAYLYYVLYLGGLLLFQAAFFGHAGLWVLSGWPALGNLAAVAGVAVMLSAGARFVCCLARTERYAPGWHVVLLGLTALGLAIIPWMLAHYHSAVIFATVLSTVAILILFPVPIVLSYLRGCRQARFLVLGMLSFFPGAVVFSLRTLGWVPASWLTEHALQVGTALEVMLFSFALADRINLLNAEKVAAQTTVINAHESERRRIARELHDGLGQNLLLLGNRLGRLAPTIPGGDALKALADDGVAELRAAARNLHPHQLDRLGLKAALESMLAQALDRAGIDYRAELDPPPLSQQQALHIYRIVQEAVSNVVRHSAAGMVTLRLAQTGGNLELEIGDDGRGIMDSASEAGLGLAGMRSRADILGGEIRIDNMPEGGARVFLRAPLANG